MRPLHLQRFCNKHNNIAYPKKKSATIQFYLPSTLLGSLLFSTSIFAVPTPTQGANPNANGTACSPAVVALASGISDNIAD